MRAVVQRVISAGVDCRDGFGEQYHAEIGFGAVIFLGIESTDTKEQSMKMAEKIATMRFFEDENEKLNKSVTEICGQLLLIPNFTLCADNKKGRRPFFGGAMHPEKATELFNCCFEKLKACGVTSVKTGVFGADMNIKVENDGPVTLIIEL